MLALVAAGLPAQEPPGAGAPGGTEQAMAAPVEAPSTTSLTAEGRPVDLARSPGRVRVFRAEDIVQSGARTLGEFLTAVLPGQAQDSGQPGGTAPVYQGGARPQDTLVLLDGLPLTDAASRTADLNTIPLVGIDRIEVLEGGASARHGTHALGGVVALYSAGTTGAGGHGEVYTGGGSDRNRRGGVFPAWGWDGGWVRFGSVLTEEQPVSETAKPYRLGTLFVGLGQRVGDGAALSLTYRSFRQTAPLPFERATPLERVFDPGRAAEYRGNQALVALRMERSPAFSWEARAGFVNLSREEPDDATDGLDRFRSGRGQVALGFHWRRGDRLGLSLLLDAQEERAVQPALLAGEERGRGRSVGAALEARWDLTPTTRLVLNARQDTLDHTFRGAEGGERDAGTYRPFSARVGVNQALGLGFRVYALAGTGASAPLLAQTMVQAREGLGELGLEKSTYLQVGLGWELGGLSARLEAGRTRYEDLIMPLSSDLAPALRPAGDPGAPVPVLRGFANSGSFRHQGAEAVLGYRTRTRVPVGLDAFVRNQEARDLNAPENPYGTPLVQNRPFTTHGLRLHVSGARIRVETRWNRVGRRYESVHTYQCSDLEPLVTPTYVSYDDLSVTTTYTWSKLFSVIVRGEHLAQKNLSVTDWQGRKTDLADNAALLYGIPAPRPSVTVEARFRY
jgi:outer membrane receptor protein involved in Fe transport